MFDFWKMWFCFAFAPLYFGGGGGSSSSASTTNNTDARLVNSGGVGITNSSGVTVNALDGGAIKSALDMVANSNAANSANYNALLRGVDGVVSAGQAGLSSAERLAGTAITSNASNFTSLLDVARQLSLSAINTQTANTAMAKDLAGSTQAVYQDAATAKQQSQNMIYAGAAVLVVAAFAMHKGKK